MAADARYTAALTADRNSLIDVAGTVFEQSLKQVHQLVEPLPMADGCGVELPVSKPHGYELRPRSMPSNMLPNMSV